MTSSLHRRPRSSASEAHGSDYSGFAADYHWFYDDVETRLGTTTPGVRAALVSLPSRARVLDAACGIGLDTLALERRGFAVTASDASAEMVALTQARCHDAGVNVSVIESRWADLTGSVGNGIFDAVLCAGNSIAHCVDRDDMIAALRGFSAVLRPGGLLVLDTHDWEQVLSLGDRVVTDPHEVERDGLSCSRSYRWRRPLSLAEPCTITFELNFDQRDELNRAHTVSLHPFTRSELRERLREAGFTNIGLDADGSDRYTATAQTSQDRPALEPETDLPTQ
jgi:SAM-dependent methyltransferase